MRERSFPLFHGLVDAYDKRKSTLRQLVPQALREDKIESGESVDLWQPRRRRHGKRQQHEARRRQKGRPRARQLGPRSGLRRNRPARRAPESFTETCCTRPWPHGWGSSDLSAPVRASLSSTLLWRSGTTRPAPFPPAEQDLEIADEGLPLKQARDVRLPAARRKRAPGRLTRRPERG